MKYEEFKKFMDAIKLLHQAYDLVRIVDPMYKQVLNLEKDRLIEEEPKCFHIWGDKGVCQNCVSMRAFNENATFIKLDYDLNKIMMITAIPCEFNNRRIVIEMMKDATNSLMFDASEHRDKNTEIQELIRTMNQIAVRDALTGSYNRRFINERLPMDLITSTLSGQSLSIVLTDIDYFKNFNDFYGHQTGDAVLKLFADTLTECLKRNTDWVARYGGEEYLICLPGASHERAVEIAENMRRKIGETEFVSEGHHLEITASFGVYTRLPGQDMDMERLISESDKKLYLAKQNGRNRVE